MSLRSALLGVLLLSLSACTESPEDLLKSAQAQLNSGSFAEARAAADKALGRADVKADKTQAWKFERLRLDALAGLKQPVEVVSGLARLSADYSAQIKPDLYAVLSTNLQKAGDIKGAIDVVDAGVKKFPEAEAAFEAVLEALHDAAAQQAEGGNSDAMNQLESLGYLGKAKKKQDAPTKP